jgi:hypothetical protein
MKHSSISWGLRRVGDRAADANPDMAQSPCSSSVREQVFGKDSVQVDYRVAVEADVRRVLDEELDGILVIEDHLRLGLVTSLCLLAEFDQASCIEQRVGVAFEAARVPSQVDQQPVQDGSGIGTSRLHLV